MFSLKGSSMCKRIYKISANKIVQFGLTFSLCWLIMFNREHKSFGSQKGLSFAQISDSSMVLV